MSKLLGRSLYQIVIFSFIIISVALIWVSLTRATGNLSENTLNVITEMEFAKDSEMFAHAENEIIIVFLESPISEDEPDDTGVIGRDIIPYKYEIETEQTFCWDDDNPDSNHFMRLLDSDGVQIFRINGGGECVTKKITPGVYKMHITHDGINERRVAIFIVPDGHKSLLTTAPEEVLENITTVLNTNKCIGCNLSGVNLFNADLSNVDLRGAILNDAILVDANLSGADLSGAQLVNADLSRANLAGTNLSGADLTNAILIKSDLTDANLTLAVLDNTDFTNAKLNNTNKTVIGYLKKDKDPSKTEFNLTPISREASGMPEMCSTGTLPAGDGTMDLLISGPCMVGSDTYQYRNVNVINNGVLEFVDNGGDTHFWAKSILVEAGGSMIAGTNSNKGQGAFGAKGGTLTIHLYGSETDKEGIMCKTLDSDGIQCGIPTMVWNSNNPPTEMTKPDAKCTKMELPGGVEDCFYRYLSPNGSADETGFFGRKVLAVSYNGTLKLFGKKGATYVADGENTPNWDSGMSWVRLKNDKDAKPEKTIISLDREVDWEEGDRIVITTTDYLPGHSEELQIVEKLGENPNKLTKKLRVTIIDPLTNKPPDGCTSPPLDNDKCGLRYHHNGDIYPDEGNNLNSGKFERLNLDIKIMGGGEDDGKPRAETRAAVALLTRSIRIVSGGNTINVNNPTCTYDCFPRDEGYFGAHTQVRQGVKEYQVQGVEFYQLGQGGKMGRYPTHFHLVRQAPPNTFLKDNSIHDSMTRWITLHATHDVTLARNVGFKSIGHGFYLEDGTEINNRLYSNIGIFARAGIDNEQNPRKVPGIFAQPRAKDGKQVAEVPFNSDFANPTVFWIMNGWNDFEYNMAVGAGSCGACYWLLPSRISGISQNMVWESYASIQKLFFGTSPLKKFEGNYCSTAQLSFNTVGATDACNGIGDLSPIINNPPPNSPNFFPLISSLRNPTICNGTCDNNTAVPCGDGFPACPGGGTCTQNCTGIRQCGVGDPGNPDADDRKQCPVTILDRYTSAFHWPEKNFAAIWLRGKWYLYSNSVLSDSQNGGLGLVTGGDYTLSSVVPGNWQVASNSVFIGNTQTDEENPLASNAGPFNPLVSRNKKITGLKCDNTDNRSLFCLSKKEGVVFPISNFSMQQRLFNVYDGPNAQDSNAYLDITTTSLAEACTPGDCPQVSDWMYTAALGVPIDVNKKSKHFGQCVLPNAAIGWKQPNGFYYPPGFHSKNLLFKNVDIRHLVIEPLWKPNTFESDLDQVKVNYCTFDPETTFKGFTAVDRQTVLNDDDGSLTGLLSDGLVIGNEPHIETISVNLTEFFIAPSEAPECKSFDIAKVNGGTTGGTAKTSPYEYLTAAVYPACAIKNGNIRDCGGLCSVDQKSCAGNSDCPGDGNKCIGSKWGEECTNDSCYGINLTRQLFTPDEQNGTSADRTIQMMGMSFWQRSMLTLNESPYYIDTRVSEDIQKQGRGGAENITNLNVFQPSDTYYLFFLYATERSKQEYQIFIGKDIPDFETDMKKYIRPVRVDIQTQDLQFQEENVVWDGLNATYNPQSGIVRVNTDFSEFKDDFTETKKDYCQPSSFCRLVGDNCVTSLDTGDPMHDLSDRICKTWAGKDIDCPLFEFNGKKRKIPGCLGIAITLGNETQFIADNEPAPNEQPYASCFSNVEPWNVIELIEAGEIAGEGCRNQNIDPPQLCQ